MKIKEIITEHGNDFTADLICEHCAYVQKLTSGYHDNFYHTQVVPGMHCKACGKNRAGELSHSFEAFFYEGNLKNAQEA